MRSYDRSEKETRPVEMIPDFTKNADASVLISYGETRVLCTAFLEDRVPPFLRNQRKGWVTAEYGMLPGATLTRSPREAARGKQSGRTVEISRLIGRTLRTCVDMDILGERTVTVDCDVLQADGGTRTASITGGCAALILCLFRHTEKFDRIPILGRAAAVSLGIVESRVLVDLDYNEDFNAETDLNLVMDQRGRYIEIQGTAEKDPFEGEQLTQILALGGAAIAELSKRQADILRQCGVTEEWIP
ncbi:MAG: ribonuclease PH [Acidobacteriota bacterium]|nr:ribonuclease PH [Acidobacteriota bacterium]